MSQKDFYEYFDKSVTVAEFIQDHGGLSKAALALYDYVIERDSEDFSAGIVDETNEDFDINDVEDWLTANQ